MKIPLKWLREYVPVNITAEELAFKLTLAGLETEEIENQGKRWDKVAVGQVAGIEPHPNADKLRLATIDLGTEQHTVVCGAPNLVIGDKVAFAKEGAKLIDGHNGQAFELKAAKIRGVLSRGMVLSEKELGISEFHEGILILPSEAPPGIPLAEYLGDVVFNIEVTPNRPDCLSILGIAHEVAALLNVKVKEPSLEFPESGSDINSMVRVEIKDSSLCPRYCAGLVTDVEIGPSPSWMQERLTACGLRPINNIVDITNYVLMEYGQPLHAFDFQKLQGARIIVRPAGKGENMYSLDGSQRNLEEEMLLIADEHKGVAIAGVMGGVNSEVAYDTRIILLESASFNPVSIRRTSSNLRLKTEASLRFERGISPELTIPALKRAISLISALAKGKPARGIIDLYPGKKGKEPIPFSSKETRHILGMDIDVKHISETLESLGFECQHSKSDKEELEVKPPYWRSDIHGAADLAEEIARIMGYDQIPTTLLGSAEIPDRFPDISLLLKDEIRDILVQCGMQEIITYSLTNIEIIEKAKAPTSAITPLKLANPLSSLQDSLRTNLRSGLLSILSFNERRQEDSYKLFELGRIYIPEDKGLPDEREMLAGILSGLRPRGWDREEGELNFYDAKGILESLFSALGLKADFVPSSDPGLSPGKQAEILINKSVAGVIGEIHHDVQEAFEIKNKAFLFEIDISVIEKNISPLKPYYPVTRYPSIIRDMALIVDSAIPSGQIIAIMKKFPLIEHVWLFDLYTGAGITKGKKSLAYRLVFQAPDRSLTDEEVKGIQEQIIEKLHSEFGTSLRGS